MKGLTGKIQRKLRWMWRDTFVRRFPDFNRCAGEVRVLCFHGVCPDSTPYINGRFLHLSEFRSLLVLLKNRAHVLSVEEWKTESFRSDRLNILLTFDDGYANNLELALPVLEELELPSLWFVTGETESLHMDLFDIAVAAKLNLQSLAKCLNSSSKDPQILKRQLVLASASEVRDAKSALREITLPYLDDYSVFWKLLDDAQLESLRTHALVTIGNHTGSHLCLVAQNPLLVEMEVERVDERLKVLGFDSTEFLAVPYGIVNNALIEIFRMQKERWIMVNEMNPEIEGFAFERLTVNPFISLKNQAYAIYYGDY